MSNLPENGEKYIESEDQWSCKRSSGPGIYFNAFIHVYSPSAGQKTPWGQMLMSTESPYHFAHSLLV